MPQGMVSPQDEAKIQVIIKYLSSEFPACQVPRPKRPADTVDYEFTVDLHGKAVHILRVARPLFDDMRTPGDIRAKLLADNVAERLRGAGGQTVCWDGEGS